MAEQVSITFYRISRCGLYKGHDKTPTLSNIEHTLRDLGKWSKGLTLEQTKTYTPADGGSLPVYLADIGSASDTWLVTLWNETHGVNENVPSLMANAGVGQASVILNKAKKGSIPGFATYFWFIPALDVFATLRFARPFTGQTALQSYLGAYLSYFSSFTVRSDKPNDAGEFEVVGYRDGSKGDVLQLHPRFKAKIFTKPGDHEHIIQNADKVRRVLKKDVLSLKDKVELSDWQHLLQFAGVTPRKTRGIQSANLELSIDVELDEKGVTEIIDDWKQSGGAEAGSDFGFLLRGETKEYWLARSLARDKFVLDLKGQDLELIDRKVLLRELLKQYTDITAILAS